MVGERQRGELPARKNKREESCVSFHSGLLFLSLHPQLCRRYPGFMRVALQDPQPERRFFRRGWATFAKNVNIKDICWNLNNIRVSKEQLRALQHGTVAPLLPPVVGHDSCICGCPGLKGISREERVWNAHTEKTCTLVFLVTCPTATPCWSYIWVYKGPQAKNGDAKHAHAHARMHPHPHIHTRALLIICTHMHTHTHTHRNCLHTER